MKEGSSFGLFCLGYHCRAFGHLMFFLCGMRHDHLLQMVQGRTAFIDPGEDLFAFLCFCSLAFPTRV
jgi:hypothetical protein